MRVWPILALVECKVLKADSWPVAANVSLVEARKSVHLRSGASVDLSMEANPNAQCGSCNPLNDGENCCDGKKPSELQRCSADLPKSLKGNGGMRVSTTVWDQFLTFKCSQDKESMVANLKCDPCRPSATTKDPANAAADEKILYCVTADGDKDGRRCYGESDFYFECMAGSATYDAYGGWKLVNKDKINNDNVCQKEAKEYQDSYNAQQPDAEAAKDTWKQDSAFACGEGGTKPTTGTDFCHDDWCTYDAETAPEHENRLPHTKFISCEKEVEDTSGSACSEKDDEGSERWEKFRNGCRKTCGICVSSRDEDSAVAHTIFDVCNGIYNGNKKNTHEALKEGETCDTFKKQENICGKRYKVNNGEYALCYFEDEECKMSTAYTCGQDVGGLHSTSEDPTPKPTPTPTPVPTEASDNNSSGLIELRSATKRASGASTRAWPADKQMGCREGGYKNTTGTQYCHDDYCIYEAGTSDPARLPYENFISCKDLLTNASATGTCAGEGRRGCRLTCNHCEANPVVPDAD